MKTLRNITVAPKRCAVYTRVSSDERLDQSFNSLDAQREAGLAFIESQRHEGWTAVADAYDDGGFSGGNTTRPALQRLFADIEAGRVHVVVIYKLDRLSRSLKDFINMLDHFDQHGATFVSVTEQFKTTSADGRLHLNMTLAFAQYMREQTGERIRDKVAASKRRGLWMGGTPPLGYDVRSRKLVINAAEAAVVRAVYARYAEHGSAARLVRELAKEGRTTKTWVTQEGKLHQGGPIDQQVLFVMLRNRLYIGDMTHKGASYPGAHEPIIDATLWQAVQNRVAQRERGPRRRQKENPALLSGLLYSIDGQRMLSSYTLRKDGKRYTYYVPYLDKRRHAGSSASRTIGAAEIEQIVLAHVHQRLQQPEVIIATWQQAMAMREGSEATIAPIDEAHAVVTLRDMGAVWGRLYPAEQHRIVRLLINRVQFVDEGLRIDWNDDALAQVSAEAANHPFVLEQRASNAAGLDDGEDAA